MAWNVAMPTTPGEYEIRLFKNGTYTRLATSETITVGDSGGGEPPSGPGEPTIEVNTTSLAAGQTLTVTMTNGPGNLYDWMAVSLVGSPDSSYVRFTYVTRGETSMTWNVSMPTTPGQYEVRLFENAGYNRLATSDAITVTE